MNNGSCKPLADRFWAKVSKDGPIHPVLGTRCWVWTKSKKKGYGQIQEGARGGRVLTASRVAWELTYGPITSSVFVLHRCDNPSCVRPDHLFDGNAKDNSQDMVRKGRHRGTGVFLPDQVRAIRRLREDGFKLREIGDHYDLSVSHVHDICSRRLWANVA